MLKFHTGYRSHTGTEAARDRRYSLVGRYERLCTARSSVLECSEAGKGPKKVQVQEQRGSSSVAAAQESGFTSHLLPMEADVGITVYRSDSPGYSAILKHRYKDFIVNEIDGQGNVVRLPEQEAAASPQQIETLTDEAAAAFKDAVGGLIPDDHM